MTMVGLLNIASLTSSKHMFTNQPVLLNQSTRLVRVSKGTIKQYSDKGLLKFVSLTLNRGSISKLFNYVGAYALIFS